MGNNELTIWGRKHNNIPDSEGKHVGQEPKLGASVGQGSFGKYQKSSWEKKKKKISVACMDHRRPTARQPQPQETAVSLFLNTDFESWVPQLYGEWQEDLEQKSTGSTPCSHRWLVRTRPLGGLGPGDFKGRFFVAPGPKEQRWTGLPTIQRSWKGSRCGIHLVSKTHKYCLPSGSGLNFIINNQSINQSIQQSINQSTKQPKQPIQSIDPISTNSSIQFNQSKELV